MKTQKFSFEQLVDREARDMARKILQRELHAKSISVPENLDDHIETLLISKPRILEIALDRVMARQDAYSISLAAIGIDAEGIKIVAVLGGRGQPHLPGRGGDAARQGGRDSHHRSAAPAHQCGRIAWPP